MVNLKSNNGSFRLILFGLSSLTLASCAQSQFGQDLADNFDNLPQTIQTSIASSSEPSPQSDDSLIRSTQVPMKIKTLSKVDSQIERPKEKKLQNKINTKTSSFNPQPYRIIINLSGADPSAPAEEVTKALRLAGVQFHVEKIERIELKNSFKVRPNRAGPQP